MVTPLVNVINPEYNSFSKAPHLPRI
jgi:hypothetical protein